MWHLEGDPAFSATELRAALLACLVADAPPKDRVKKPWPALALSGLGIRLSRITLPGPQKLAVQFDHPLFDLPGLLLGCRLNTQAGKTPRAPFSLDKKGDLVANPQSVDGPPLLSRIRFVKSGEPAEVDLSPGAEALGKTVRPLFNDVVLLLVRKPSQLENALGMDESDPPGFFAQRLGADLILSVVENASGENADRILPPRLRGQDPVPATIYPSDLVSQIPVVPLAANAADLIIAGDPDDPLLAESAARLEVWARSRNQRVTFVASDDPAQSRAVAELVRWRVPTEDGLFALLALGGLGPADLMRDLEELGTPFKAQLRSSDPSDRATAAATLEALWLERRRVIPLFYVEVPAQVSPRVGGERAGVGARLDLRDAYEWTFAP
jgi:hypothetical protein